MTPPALRDLARRIWPLDWQIDLGATTPAAATAQHGALVVAVVLTARLTIVGSLGDEEFSAAEDERHQVYTISGSP